MSEAMDRVKLENPEDKKTGTEDSPTPEQKAESEKAKNGEPAAKDEQAGDQGKADDSANDHFDKRPEWGELNKALGKDGAKKVRPIIRNLMERERRATDQVTQLRPVVDELKRYTVDDAGFKKMRDVVRAFAEDPSASVPVLEQMLESARQRSGHVVTSPDLKQRLAVLDKKLEDGHLDEETHALARDAILEAEKGRAGAKSATAKVQQTQTQRLTEARQAAMTTTLNSLNAWETNIRERDPDFGNVTPAEDPKHGESVADRVFDALQLKFSRNPNATTEELIAEATRVHKLARGQLARPAARESRPVTTTGSSTTAKPKPKTMREAMDHVKLT